MEALSRISDVLSGLEAAVVEFGTSPQAMLVVIAVCWLDGFFPPVPSELVVIAAATTLAGSGGSAEQVALLVAAAAVGAFAGDATAYTLGSRSRIERWRPLRTPRGRANLARARATLDRHGSSYVMASRFIPVGRVVVNLTAGMVGFPRSRFLPLTAAASVLWAAQQVTLGMATAHLLGGSPMVAMVAGIAVGLLTGVVLDRVASAVRARRNPETTPLAASRAMVSAHRGAARQSGSRDNSWESLLAAVLLPVDFVEFDLHRTADGEFVLHHGGRVLGLDGRRRRIRTSTCAELLETGAYRMTRYRDALELLRGHGKRAHIDLKFTDSTAGRSAGEIAAAEIALAVMGEPSAFLITSGADRSVRKLRDWAEARSPGTVVGVSLGLHRWPSAVFPGRRLRRCGASAVAVDHRLGCLRLLAWAHRRDILVLVWTVDRSSTLRRMQVDPRVWMVVTNHPGRAELVEAQRDEQMRMSAA